jgi:sugar/nucleoside kinase (ribokinase family)
MMKNINDDKHIAENLQKGACIMKKGICVAGNAIVDLLYNIENYPNEGELTTIQEDGINKSTGGALCNVVVDLAKLDPELPLVAIGQIGNDDNAQLIKDTLSSYSNIDTSGIKEEGSLTTIWNYTTLKPSKCILDVVHSLTTIWNYTTLKPSKATC